MYLLQFLVVGASGMVVNLATLSALQFIGMADWVALMGGIGVSVISNFLLNRRFTFSYARRRNPWTQFRGFLVASLVGILVNYVVAIQLSRLDWFQGPFGLQFAAMTGIACGLVFNFLGNRFAVFRRQHLRGDSRR
ncbi:GtrA family protein [Seohaeicola zhoushanensis]